MHTNVLAAGKRCGRVLAWCLTLAAASSALAQSPGPVCKYVDAKGNVIFSNLPPEKGYRKISCLASEGTSRGGSGRPTATPPGFPRVDADTQRSRDDLRRKVLGDELAAEEKLLAEARANYANGAPPPLPEERANPARYQERIARLREAVQLHERNIEALKKELGST